jgi:hypothetical protein
MKEITESESPNEQAKSKEEKCRSDWTAGTGSMKRRGARIRAGRAGNGAHFHTETAHNKNFVSNQESANTTEKKV